MNRPFRKSDGGKRFRYLGEGKFHGRIGELEAPPLTDPGSALPGEGILWFGPQDDRDGWDYVEPADVQPSPGYNFRPRRKRRAS